MPPGVVMLVGIIILTVFFLGTLALGGPRLRAGQTAGDGEVAFFLSGRSLGSVALFLTLAATNFSAFTVLGLSGAGYRIGYAFYPAMAVGTGFMALGLYLIGRPMVELGAARGWVTPTDPVADRFGAPALSAAYAFCLMLYTLPYLGLQPMAAGMLLESALGVPFRVGALTVTATVALYTAYGGVRAVVRTDAVHGLLFFALAAALWFFVLNALGGFVASHEAVAASMPNLVSRPGGGAGVSAAAYAGYLALWFFADPLFPQLGQRLLATGSARAIERSVTAYPLVTALLFFFTISTGVLGAILVPELVGAAADRVWPLLASRAGTIASALLILAPLAALMTTMDSQLLTLASILLRDLFGRKTDTTRPARLVVAGLSCAGAVMAFFPPQNILDYLNRTSFLGYASLSPLLFGALYASRADHRAAWSALAAGQAAVAATGLRLYPPLPLPDVFVVLAVSWGAFFAASRFFAGRRTQPRPRQTRSFDPYRLGDILPARWALLFLAILLPGFDVWNWLPNGGKAPTAPGSVIAGLPPWVWIAAGQCVALSAAFALFFKRTRYGQRLSRSHDMA